MAKIIKIAATGPESSGKSALSRYLAQEFETVHVPEYARHYLENLDRPYQQEDLIHIARGQIDWESEFEEQATNFLFCDTELTVLKVWSLEKYNSVVPELEVLWQTRYYDLLLLCRPDLPWEPDPLRENPEDRDRLFEVYHQLLHEFKKPFLIVEGTGQKRFHMVADCIRGLFS